MCLIVWNKLTRRKLSEAHVFLQFYALFFLENEKEFSLVQHEVHRRGYRAPPSSRIIRAQRGRGATPTCLPEAG
jgi:hypothetical protein